MPGPAPQKTRRRRNTPARGEWQPAPGEGWRHGDVPAPPDNLRPGSIKAWHTWFGAWFASHWTLDMVPGLELVILAYDNVKYGHDVKASDRTALHNLMRAYGITPDGQLALRWERPKSLDAVPESTDTANDPYSGLRVVGA